MWVLLALALALSWCYAVRADPQVVITAGGKAYHRPECPAIRRSDRKQSVSLQEAKRLGKAPCGLCRPPG